MSANEKSPAGVRPTGAQGVFSGCAEHSRSDAQNHESKLEGAAWMQRCDEMIAAFSFLSWPGRLAVDDPEFRILPPWAMEDAEPLPTVDKAEAARFLALLDPEAKGFTFQTVDDSKKGKGALARILNGTLDQHWDTLVKLNNQGAGVFVCVNETDGTGRKAANITRARALFLDLDGAPLEPVLQAKPAPHVIAESSAGRFHAYWLVKDVPLDAFTGRQEALAKRFDGDLAVSDLPHVMRLPGFLHRKRAPFLTRIIQTNECEPYTAAELAELAPAAKPTYEPPRRLSSNQPPPTIEEIREAVRVIPNDDLSWDDWNRRAMAIYAATDGEDEGFEIFDEWSRKSSKYTEEGTYRKWYKQLSSSPPERITVGTLRYLANEAKKQRRAEQAAANIRIGDDIPAKSLLPSIMTLDEMHERLVFISETGAVADRVTGRIYKKEHVADAYAASKHTYDHTQENGAKKKRTVSAVRFWIESKERVTVQVLAWVPGAPQICHSPEEQKIAFNTWRGLSPMAYPEDWQERVKPFLEHVEFLVPIKEERERFLQWLAHIVQRPEVLPHTCYLMTTPTTGVGRNLLASIIVRVLRGYVAAGISLPELLDGGFTGRLSKKLMAIVDEAKEGSGERRYQRGERFKSIVNEEYRHINPKYGHQSVEKNCCRWLLFSNHHDAIPFDNSDRRVNVVANPKERKKDAAYYERLYGLLNDNAFIGSVRRWLETLDISSFRPGEHAPMNEAKERALNEMLTETERAVFEFKEECKTDLMSRYRIRCHATEKGQLHVNDTHLTHAIRRAGMTNTGRRVWTKRKDDKNKILPTSFNNASR
jgi:hypothetical protein